VDCEYKTFPNLSGSCRYIRWVWKLNWNGIQADISMDFGIVNEEKSRGSQTKLTAGVLSMDCRVSQRMIRTTEGNSGHSCSNEYHRALSE
jgi:hypothetical protein